MALHPIIDGLIKGAFSGATARVVNMLQSARSGTMKILIVFQSFEGKLDHIAILMDPKEAMKACQKTWKKIQTDAAKGKESPVTAALDSVIGDVLLGALAGAAINAGEMIKAAKGGTMKLLIILQTPDGKIDHLSILMNTEESMEACRVTYRAIRLGEDAKKNAAGAAQGGSR
jgi:hypothetical protein